MKRRACSSLLGLWLVYWVGPFAFGWGYPIRDLVTRVVIVAGGLALGVGAAVLLWRRRWGKVVLLTALVATAGLLLCPIRPHDPGNLRADYVRALETYRGVPYVRGGETRRGIDCSGLVRRALVDALVGHGIRTLNPGLVRAGLMLWWRDCSAADLGRGRHARTRPVLRTPSLNALDHDRILPGDLAVTGHGMHVLAYLGDQAWIEADPSLKAGDQVVALRAPTRESAWFAMPIRIVRWRVLDDGR